MYLHVLLSRSIFLATKLNILGGENFIYTLTVTNPTCYPNLPENSIIKI